MRQPRPDWASRYVGPLRVYLEPRVLLVLVLGFASGLPLPLTLATLTFWLAEAGIDKGAIGLFALVGTAYGWKFVWSPAIDRLPLPILTALLGRRRGWLLFTQLLLVVFILCLASTDPREALGLVAVFAVLVAFASASQDIVIDAYRVELLSEREQGAGAAVVVIGYRIAMLASGAGALVIATFFGWFWAYAGMAALMGVGIAATLLGPEPAGGKGAPSADGPGLVGHLRVAVVEPFREFFARNGAVTAAAILLFIMLYKLGDALLGTMSNPFYVELGFSGTEVASIVKVYGLLATLIGGFLGGVIVNGRGVLPALWICGIVQMLSNLVFVLQAWAGHDLAMLTVTITAENLAGGMGTTAFVAYLSSLCDVRYTATQYALLSSFMAQARTSLSASAGFLAQATGWPLFFLLTAVAALPALALLAWLQRRGGRPTPAEPDLAMTVEPPRLAGSRSG